MFKFTRKVRDSLATQLILVANAGGAGLTFLLGDKAIRDQSALALTVVVCWWLGLQIVAHCLMSLVLPPEDKDQEAKPRGDSG